MSKSTPLKAAYKGVKTAEGLKFLESEPIAVAVGTGDAGRTWHLPKELLVNASPFFAAALNGNFAEATTKRVTLPEDSPAAFALFVRWLYVGEVISATLYLEVYHGGRYARTRILLQACSLGDKLSCPVFLDLAVLELIKNHEEELQDAETICHVFAHFAPRSKLRKLVIDQLRWDIQFDRHDDATPWVSAVMDAGDFVPEFLKASLEKNPIDPQAHSDDYMQVLTGTEEG